MTTRKNVTKFKEEDHRKWMTKTRKKVVEFKEDDHPIRRWQSSRRTTTRNGVVKFKENNH